MLTVKDERFTATDEHLVNGGSSSVNTTTDADERKKVSGIEGGRLKRMLRVEWLGQTVASLCWIASMLVYGISSNGDRLQLLAASAWLLANVASIVSPKVD